MKGEAKIVYIMVAVSLLLVGGYIVLWKISANRATSGKSDLIVERSIETDFEAIDSNGEPRSFFELKGKVTLVSHVFTRCPGQCAGIGVVLDELRTEFASEGPLQFVSVSLDPEYDTPKVMKEFATLHGLEGKDWWFLTGEAEPLNRYMADTFLLTAQVKPEAQRNGERDLFDHKPRVVLVDSDLKLRGWYFPFDEKSRAQLRMELKAALAEAKRNS